MSAKVKYGSAFSPVIPSKSTLNHPFSIKNLLNIEDQSEVKDQNRAITDISQTSTLPTHPIKEATQANMNLTECLWPAWVYATRYSRHGIPPGKF